VEYQGFPAGERLRETRTMSTPSEPDPVKRIASLIAAKEERIDRTISKLEDLYGPTDWVSPVMPFDRTRYYEREMGSPLVRKFAAFERFMAREELPGTKLETNRLEDRTREQGRRTVNIDPGFVCLERLVLATGKNYTHRIYLSQGIYADLTLVFHRKCFRSLAWTYPDYADAEVIEYFNGVRERYKEQLRGNGPMSP
jgi:hypothetical protein